MKKLLTIVLALFLGATASAMTLDTAEAAAEAPAAVLAAETESNAGKPGYNLWTGTTEAYTFDNVTVVDGFSAGNVNKEWTSDTNIFIDSSSGNAALHMKGNRVRFTVSSEFSIDAKRPVTMTYKFKTSATTAMYMSVRANKYGYWLNGAAPYIWESSGYQVNLAQGITNAWTGQTKVFLPEDARNKTHDAAPTTVNQFWFQFATEYNTPVYIDDVSFIPHYKITYDIGLGTGTAPADEYFLADSYTLLANTNAFSAPAGKEFMGWVDQFGREITTTVTPVLGEDLKLTAVYVSDLQKNKPGINIWTGTAAPYTFEHNPTYGNENEEIDIVWSKSYVDSTTEEDNISMVISGDHPNISKRNVNANIDKDRPITYSFKIRTETKNNFYLRLRPNSAGKYKMINGSAVQCIAFLYNLNAKVINHGNWITQSITTTAENFKDHDVSGVDAVNNVYFFAIQSDPNDKLWIDDISIIPNYKITYDLGEGSGETPADEYFLADEYTLKADTTKIIPPAGTVFSHWVDQNGNIAKETFKPTLGEDAILTAVYVDNTPASYDKNEIRVGNNAGIRFFASVTAEQKDRATEYGYIVARYFVIAAELGKDTTDLTFDITSAMYPEPLGSLYVKGVAYENKDGGDPEKDIEYEADESGNSVFTAVCTGIDLDDATQLTEQLIVRPYITVNGIHCYGTPMVKSFYEVAVEISESEVYDTLPQEQKDMITHILEVCKN